MIEQLLWFVLKCLGCIALGIVCAKAVMIIISTVGELKDFTPENTTPVKILTQ